ncbi:hypothetical protein C2845_PM01G40670 [Panicum miliaceum]|uniref:Uncharacterized protein n=1 Tax=Panicum miliaceum TaxID=4540 RepID=A0A3L6TQV1_PANMI|nr:hypothetical protein C2845_PM01G40670 [Panicum miliaceum]
MAPRLRQKADPTLAYNAQSAYCNQPAGPLPDSYFISSNQQLPRPQALTTATKEGKTAARKRKAPRGDKEGSNKKEKGKSKKKV